MSAILDLYREGFYWIDLAIGFGAPLVVFFLYRSGRISSFHWRLFWIGAGLGLLWEVPIFILSAGFSGSPIIYYIRPQPIHFLFFLVAHTLWDGGLFLVGAWFVSRICPEPHYARFSWREMMVLILYGQISELAVEISSITGNAWVYAGGYRWNPVLFTVSGHPVTLFPQIIWLAAPVIFYFLALLMKQRGMAGIGGG